MHNFVNGPNFILSVIVCYYIKTRILESKEEQEKRIEKQKLEKERFLKVMNLYEKEILPKNSKL